MKKGFVASLVLIFGLMMIFGGLTTEVVQAEDYSFTLVAHSSAIAFWRPVQQGMEDAGESLGVDVNFTGPAEMDHGEQVSIIESLIIGEEDGIATTLTDPQAYDSIVQEGLDDDIPIIAFNADAPDNPRMAFIGQDEYDAGRDLAYEILDYVGEEGEIVLTVEDPGHTALEERISGAEDVLEDYDFEIDLLDTTTDLTTALETIMDYYEGNPDVDGWFGVSATATEAGVHAVEHLGVAGDVYAGGFDLTPDTLAGIQDGYAQFTIDQHPYLQGYYAVHALYLYNEYGIQPVDIDTGGGIIDETNVDLVIDLADDGYR